VAWVLVGDDELHPLPLGERQRRHVFRPRHVVDRPNVAGHVTGQFDLVDPVRLARRKRATARRLRSSSRTKRGWLRGLVRDARDCCGAATSTIPSAARCLENGQDRVGRRAAGDREPDVQPLRHSDRKRRAVTV